MGLYEILEINDFIREAIMRRADAGEIKKIAIKNGMTTLLEDGFRKALAGYTTIEEILRVVKLFRRKCAAHFLSLTGFHGFIPPKFCGRYLY